MKDPESEKSGSSLYVAPGRQTVHILKMHSDLSTARPALTQLSDEELMFRDAVAAFAEDEVRPRVKQMEAAGKLDQSLIASSFELGLMGIEVPEQLGGA